MRIQPFRYLPACILGLTLLGAPSRAQFVADYKRTADMYFARQDYYSAAEYYSKALENKLDKKTGFYPYEMAMAKMPSKSTKMKQYEELVYRLAESYRNYNDFLSAEKWYAQAVQFSTGQYPLARYWYGVCLRSNGKFSEALAQFQQFRSTYTTADDIQASADREIANCQFAVKEMEKTNSPFTVWKMGGTANQGGANYAPVWWMNQLTFTSSRSLPAAPKNNPYVNHLYTSRSADSAETAFQLVDVPGQSMELGVSALTPDGLTMFLTQWSVKDGKKQADLYKSERKGTSWSEPAKLSTLDVPGSSTMQPAVSTDGKYLLFSSDRPGGLGKFDLWYAPLDNTGNPGTAVNLGTLVNSAGDDEAPYYDAGMKVLIFSTNGRVGMGNFDFFQSQGDLANLTAPVNMGMPMNSSKDDMYFASTSVGKGIYKNAFVSSDRASSCCLELFKVTRRGKRIDGDIVSCDTPGKYLDGVEITLLDPATKQPVATTTTDGSGMYGFDLDDPGDFKVVAKKEGYFTKTFSISSGSMTAVDTLNDPELCLRAIPLHAIELKNILYDFNKASLRPESFIVLDTLVSILDDNPTMTIELGSHTDGIGSVKYNLKLSDARAKSCVDYLVSKGIDPARLTSRGYGKCCPIAPEKMNGKDYPEGRQLNRRTEFSVRHR